MSADRSATVSRWDEPARVYASVLLDRGVAEGAVAEALRAMPEDHRDPTAVLDLLRPVVARRMVEATRQSSLAAAMPVLIAARDTSRLGARDIGRLARHLDACPRCATVQGRIRAAERAFHAVVEPTAPAPRPRRRIVAVAATLAACVLSTGALAASGVISGDRGPSPAGTSRAGTAPVVAAVTRPSEPRPSAQRLPAGKSRAGHPRRARSVRRRAPAHARRTVPRRRRSASSSTPGATTPATPRALKPATRKPRGAPPPVTPTPAPPAPASSTEPLPSAPSPDPGRLPPR